jgi:DNA anti-recombination protein RmuC
LATLNQDDKNVREELFENEEQYVTSLRNSIQKIHEMSRKTSKTAQETMKRDYDSKMREIEYRFSPS